MKTFFLGMENELVIVKASTTAYTYSTHLKGNKPTRLAFDPQDEQRIYCSTKKEGLFKSEDGGKSWDGIGQDDIPFLKVTAVAVDPIKRVNGNSVVYAGTEPSHLYYSEDNGETWNEDKGINILPSKENWSFPPRPNTHFIRWITPSKTNENHIGVSIEAGAFIRTEDGGETWIDRPEDSPIDTHTLLAHPDAPGRLYSASGDKAYAESNDEGQSWSYMTEGIEEHPYLYNMILNPSDPNERLVSASKSATKAHRSPMYSTIYRKIGNQSWKELADGLPKDGAFTHNLAADPSDIGVFYALNNHGVFRLSTEIAQWNKLGIKWKQDYLNQKPATFAVKEF